jgi:hypothetical protein
VRTEGARWGFDYASRWFFHAAHPWIDIRYDLAEGWSERPQAVQFCFPLAIAAPVYRYDVGGAILVAGPVAEGGHDLPGANPALYAVQTFAAAHGDGVGLYLLSPDAYLVRFGAPSAPGAAARQTALGAYIASVPMMNLTRNDWQFGQGGERCWTFRYRLVFAAGYDPLQAVREAQRFCVPPYLLVPGVEPTLPGLGDLDLQFAGGPAVALKVAEDGERLILRLWNVLDRPVNGTVRLPAGFARGERCDALERQVGSLDVEQRRAAFTVGARGIGTIALCRA